MSATTSVAPALAEPGSAAPSARRFVALVVAGVAVLQLLWIAVVPPFRGTDEFDHAYRAAGVAAGQWRATEAPQDGRGLLVVAPESLVRAAHDQCESLSYTGPDNCSPVDHVGDGMVTVGSGAGGYHPAFYWVIGTAAEPFSGATALYVMRATAALLCLLFVAMAAYAIARRQNSRWSRVGLVVAMTPVLLYSTVLPAPNGIEMAAALAFWCALLASAERGSGRVSRSLVLVAALSAAVLMVGRMLGPLFALLALSMVLVLDRGLLRRTVRQTRLFVGGSALVLAAAAWGVAWFLLNGAGEAGPEREGGEWRWSRPVQWSLQSIAAFPFRDQPGALVVYPVVLMCFVALVVASFRVAGSRGRLVLTLTMLVGLGLPLLLTALTYEGRGAMWQGRYGLPFTVGIVLLAAHLLDVTDWSSRLEDGVHLMGAALLAIGTGACLLKVLRMELARPESALDPSWLQPAPGHVVVGVAVAFGLFYFACARGGRARAG